MKKSVTQFDLSAAFKALDEMEYPKVEGGILPNRIDLRESFGNRKLRTDVLIEDYYDVNDTNDLEAAADEREAEIAKAKLARIEKIVDLDADSEDDLLTSYEGKVIIQCPQCMTLFYKDEKDLEVDENSPDVVNINETCQHCGNTSGYMVIGKVAPVDEAELDNFDTEDFEEKPEEETEEVEETKGTEEDENIDDLDVLDLDFEEEPEENKEEETNESLNKAEIQKDVDKKHCSENDSENITLNEDLAKTVETVEPYEDLLISEKSPVYDWANWTDKDFANDNSYYDNYKKAQKELAQLAIKYAKEGIVPKLSEVDSIAKKYNIGSFVEPILRVLPYLDRDMSLKEEQGEAAKQDELQAEHETPIKEEKTVCEKCGKEICECGKQELKESEIDDIINSVINSWGLNEDVNTADDKKLPVGVETAAEQKEKLALIKALRAHGDKKLADQLRALTLSEIKDLLNKGNKDIDPKDINKTFDNFVKNWGGENNTTTTKTKPAIGITEAVDDDTILINYEDIKKACLDAKKAGKNCPYAGGKYKLFGIDKLYNTIITKEVEAAAIPEKVKTIRDELLANNDDVIGVYVSRVFKNKEDNKTYEVALDKYEKFKPGYEIEVADDEETTEVEESLNKADVQKDVDKKHCAENDSENLTLNEAALEESARIITTQPITCAGGLDYDPKEYNIEIISVENEDSNLPVYVFRGTVDDMEEFYREKFVSDADSSKYGFSRKQFGLDESLKEAAEEEAPAETEEVADEVVEEPVETDVEETKEKEKLPEVDFTTSEVKEVATDVAQALSTPVEDEEEAEKQAEEIAEVVDEKVADAVEEKVETEEQATEEVVEEPVANEEAADETEVIEEPVEKAAELDEALKIIADISDYTPWSGAVDTFNKIKDAGKLDQLEEYLEECYPEGLQMVQLNDILWFDSEDILSYLGLAEDEEDEDFDESLKEADNTSNEVSDAEFDKLVDSKAFNDMLNDPNALAECNINKVFENVDEADEKAFEECITEALRKTYENVKSFTLDECVLKDNKFIVEGTINFNSGKTRKTQYVFESAARAESKAILEGYNKALSEDGNFRINCVLKESCLVPQSMSYKYTIGEHLVEGLATRK